MVCSFPAHLSAWVGLLVAAAVWCFFFRGRMAAWAGWLSAQYVFPRTDDAFGCSGLLKCCGRRGRGACSCCVPGTTTGLSSLRPRQLRSSRYTRHRFSQSAAVHRADLHDSALGLARKGHSFVSPRMQRTPSLRWHASRLRIDPQRSRCKRNERPIVRPPCLVDSKTPKSNVLP